MAFRRVAGISPGRPVRSGEPGEEATAVGSIPVLTVLIMATAVAVPHGVDAAQASTPVGRHHGGHAPADKASYGPRGVNPFTSFGADPATLDHVGWRAELARRLAPPDARVRSAAGTATSYQEREPADVRGANDAVGAAEPLARVGTRPGQHQRATITGRLASEAPTVVAVAPPPEDNGALGLAGDTAISGQRRAIMTTAEIGDGPHGSAGSGTGDFDFYALSAGAGDVVTVDVDTPSGALDSFVALYGSDGALLSTNDDASNDDTDSFLTSQVASAGRYTVMVGSWAQPTSLPRDPTDPASGPGVSTQGPYDLRITAAQGDRDAFAVRLQAGDVLGGTVRGSAFSVQVYDPAGELVVGSSTELGAIYPDASPLPRGGNVTADHVAERPGSYTVVVATGSGDYEAELGTFRPSMEDEPVGTVQTVLLDVDGATVDAEDFEVPNTPGERTLSPLSTFLTRWGLTVEDEPAVVEVIRRIAQGRLNQAVADGGNPRAAVRVVTTRDGADPWGRSDVSRVVISGSTAEFGFSTIGISASIDPGNFEHADTALLLLDLISAPAGPANSLNTYLGPQSDRVEFVGRVLGRLSAHEAGHFLGSWHTSRLDELANVVDQGGGSFPRYFGVGPDNVGGTADDELPVFGPGPFSPTEGFSGIEDTAVRTAWGLAGGRR